MEGHLLTCRETWGHTQLAEYVLPAFVEQQSTLGNALRRLPLFMWTWISIPLRWMDRPLARAGMLVPGTILLFDEYFGWPGWDLME